MIALQRGSFREFELDGFPVVGADYRRMAVVDVVLRDLALVLLQLLLEEVDREPLLEERVALVLLVLQDREDGRLPPLAQSHGRLDSPFLELPAY